VTKGTGISGPRVQLNGQIPAGPGEIARTERSGWTSPGLANKPADIAGCFTANVASERQVAEARRQATRIHHGLGEDLRRLREDAGVARSQLAVAAGIDLAFLCRIEDGRERPSLDTYVRLTNALGSDFSARIYPNTGPSIRDRHQARILEALLSELHVRWRPYPEVAVREPARGWIDAVLHAQRDEEVVATEIQSDLRRIEQQIRWFGEKVRSLPSWEGWPQLGSIGEPSRLLVVRSTRATRRLGREFERQLSAAYPAHPADAIASLTGTKPWSGAALVWADIEPRRVRLIGRR
jgi:transcriptional regulator with XRE-family HTH domain